MDDRYDPKPIDTALASTAITSLRKDTAVAVVAPRFPAGACANAVPPARSNRKKLPANLCFFGKAKTPQT